MEIVETISQQQTSVRTDIMLIRIEIIQNTLEARNQTTDHVPMCSAFHIVD